MKNLYLATKSFRELVILAEDEQRRAGHPEIDVEHLFLALLGVGGAVTNTLNSRGITLASARGIRLRSPTEDRIVGAHTANKLCSGRDPAR